MKIHRLAACLVLASTALLGRAQISSNTCYAIADGANNSTSQDQLVTIDKTTGVTTSIGNTGTFDAESLALWPNNNALFTCDNAQLVRLNLTTGAKTVIGPATQTVNGSLGSIVVNDIDGLTFDSTVDPPILYAAARRGTSPQNDLLLIISTNTGLFVSNAFGPGKDYIAVSNLTVNGNIVLHDVDDIAHDPSTDTMYGILNNGGTEDHLVTIDLATGASTDVGLLSIDDAEGLSFFVDGSLFVTTGNAAPTAERNRLYDIDKATGNATNPRQITGNVDWEGSTCFTAVTSLVGDKVWRDLNQDGIQDPGEPGMPNVTVRIYRVAGNTLVQTKQTDSQGEYSFVVPPDDYYITFTLPSGYSFTAQNAPGSTTANDSDANTATGQTANFTQSPSETDLGVDAGLICNDPVVTCPPNITLECPANTTPGVTGTATATSPCGCSLTVTFADTPTPLCGATFSIVRRWTATDQCGNSSFCDQTITVQDTTDPVLSGVPGNATASCASIPAPAVVTAADECDAVVPVVLSVATNAGACAQSYSLVLTWTATDDCGNQASQSQTITVTDTVAPVISGVGGPLTVECDQPVVFSSPTVADTCDPAPTLTFSDATVVGTCPQNFTRTRTWTASDACGNQSTESQTITVRDTVAPVINGVGGPSTIECNAPVVFSTPAASDNCDTTPTLTFSDATAPGSCPQNFVRTRTWTATDDCGNSGTASQTITVRDTVAPVISGVGGPSTIECNAPVVFSTPAASDNCDTTPTLTFSDATVPGTCPQNFVRTRTWTATDDCGNSSTASQAITVRDTVAPVIIGVGGPSTIECNAPVVFSTPTATDNCDTTPTLTFSDATAPGTCPQNFTRTRTWTATDDCGNSGTASQAITVRDTVAPVVTCPAPITLECGAAIPAANPSSVLAVDACDPTPVVTHVGDVSNGLLCPRTITRTYRATDACGNAATCTQLITVQDTTAPVQVGTLADQLVQCDGQVPPPLQPVMTDACDTNLTFSVQTLTQFSTVPGNCSKTILYRWTIRDDCNNTQRVNQRTIVRDRTRPVITCPAPVTLVGDLNCQAAIPALSPVVTDNCDPSPTVTQSPAAGTILGPGTHTVTITAVDVCGNSQSCATTVTIECPALPGIQILKSVYLGHDGGASCPGLEKVYGMAGTPITYCFLVINTGQVALVNVSVTDPILNLTASVGNLAAGQTATRFAETTLSQDLVNVATGTGTPPSGPPVSDTDPAEVKRISPSIDIQKTAQNGAGAPCPGLELVSALNGDPLTYCFTVTNTGDTPLRNVTVSDDLLGIPPFLVGVNGLLSVGQSVSTQLTAVANGSVTNIAEVTGYPPMGPPVSDDDPAQVVTFGPGVRFKKTIYAGNNGVAGCPGVDHLGITGPTQVTYCFEVTNTGDLPLFNVVIRDTMLAYTNSLGTVPVGQTVYRALPALVSSAVTNVATATLKPGTGLITVTNSAVVGLYSPSLQITKKIFAGHGDAAACDTAGDNLSAPLNSPVTYCFEVLNTGDTHLNNITVFDNDLAVGDTAMEFIRGTFPLPPGQSVLYTYKALVQGALVNTASALANSATPEGRRIGGLPNSTDSDSAVLQVAPAQP